MILCDDEIRIHVSFYLQLPSEQLQTKTLSSAKDQPIGTFMYNK
jgi:hypothetical protein